MPERRVCGMLHYSVVEHFEDGPPESIGDYDHWLSGRAPIPGEELRPCFADRIPRRALYIVDGDVLHVRAEDGWDLWCDLWRSIYAVKETYGDPPHFRRAAQWMADGGFVAAALGHPRLN